MAFFADTGGLCLLQGAPVLPIAASVQGGVLDTCADPGGLCLLQGAPVLPIAASVQGGVFDTCVISGFAVPFISPAIRVRASCFLSIWNAWPRSIENSENNRAAPIESRAEFLFIMHLRMSGTLTLVLAMRISNQRASRSCSRLVHVYQLIYLDFLTWLLRCLPRRVPRHSTRN